MVQRNRMKASTLVAATARHEAIAFVPPGTFVAIDNPSFRANVTDGQSDSVPLRFFEVFLSRLALFRQFSFLWQAPIAEPSQSGYVNDVGSASGCSRCLETNAT